MRYEGPLWEGISSEAKDFIGGLLQVDPDDRPTASKALHDPWFSVAAGESPKCRQDLIEKVQDSIVRYADTGEFRKLALNVIAKKSTSEEIFELRKGSVTAELFAQSIGVPSQKSQYHTKLCLRSFQRSTNLTRSIQVSILR